MSDVVAAGAAFSNRTNYIVLAVWITALGAFFMLAPNDWYGRAWSYFSQHGMPLLPAGGFGMGLCLAVIGVLELIQLWRNSARFLASLFFLAGFVFWAAGIILAAEGLASHSGGVIEAPLLGYLGIHKFVIMAVIMTDNRRRKAAVQ